MTLQVESSRFARHVSVAGVLLLVAVAAVALFAGAAGATSSKPGAGRYWLYLPVYDDSFEFDGISSRLPGGMATFCVTGGFKRVGQGLAVRIYSKSTGALVLAASVPLRSDLTESVLGQGGGRTFKAYGRILEKESRICSITWSDPANIWDVKIWAE